MRVRGRRVVLLIAGALPLLAEDDHHYQQHESPNSALPQEQDLGTAAEVVVDEDGPLSLLPLNLLQVESELDNGQKSDYTAGKTSLRVRSPENLNEPSRDEQTAKKEPPDKDGSKEEPEAEAEGEVVDDSGTEESEPSKNKAEGDEAVEASSTEELAEEESESAAATVNLVADAAEDVKEETGVEPVEVEDSEDTEKRNTSANNDEKDADISSEEASIEDTTTGTDAINTDNHTEEDIKSDSEGKEDDSDETMEKKSPEDDLTSEENQQQQTQQPTDGPQVDKVADEDEDGNISNRVAVDYASKSAGALVLDKSSNFKGTSNLLNGNRDKYAISPCEENKFVVLSLSEDILVKQVKLANYEMYSSRVKDFQIQISQTMGNWVDLGSYTASSASGVQSFDLKEPAWGRYLKFKFTSHYGDEYYCTLSQIMVHGSTMVQGFHEHLQESSNDEEEEQQLDGTAAEARENLEQEGNKTNEFADPSPNFAGDAEADAASDGKILDQSEKDDATDATTAEGEAPHEASESWSDDEQGPESEDDGTDGDEDDAPADALESSVGDEEENTTISGGEHGNETAVSNNYTNTSDTLPAASIGVSSRNVFTSIMGRLEPLHLKSIHRLSNMATPNFQESSQLHTILTRASDSTMAIKKALTDPAILENLQIWSEVTTGQQFPPEAFGTSAIGPREQTLTEKLAYYIQHGDTYFDEEKKKRAREEEQDSSDSSEDGEIAGSTDGTSKHLKAEDETNSMEMTREHKDNARQKKVDPAADSYDTLHDTDLALATLLDKLPSIDCLKKLDFAAFKEKALATRKGGHAGGGHAGAGIHVEPIFKTLTDQIKVLQSSLSVHDQFTKEAVQCYQKVLLDVVVELQTMRMDHESRLSKLEQDLEETKTVRWIFVLYQLVMGLPNWASLFAATFFTSFVSRDSVAKPIDLVQGFVAKHLSEGENFLLSWTITVCIVVLSCLSTLSLCQRLIATIRGFRSRLSQGGKKNPGEEDSCRFTVENAEGKVVSVSTSPLSDSDTAVAAATATAAAAAADFVSTANEEARGNEPTSPGDVAIGKQGAEAALYAAALASGDPGGDGSGGAPPPTRDLRAPGSSGSRGEETMVVSMSIEAAQGLGKVRVDPVEQADAHFSSPGDDKDIVLERTKGLSCTDGSQLSLNAADAATTADEGMAKDDLRDVEATANESSRETWLQDESGLRTPSIADESDSAFEAIAVAQLDASAKGPVSPSSVAKVSELNGESDCAEGLLSELGLNQSVAMENRCPNVASELEKSPEMAPELEKSLELTQEPEMSMDRAEPKGADFSLFEIDGAHPSSEFKKGASFGELITESELQLERSASCASF